MLVIGAMNMLGKVLLSILISTTTSEIVQHIFYKYIVPCRQLEGEIAEEWNVDNMETLLSLVRDVISFDMKHSAEIQACDLLMDIDRLDLLAQHMDASNYPRVCLYLIGYVKQSCIFCALSFS